MITIVAMAKDLIMKEREISEPMAHYHLQKLSMDRRVKIEVIAKEVVERSKDA